MLCVFSVCLWCDMCVCVLFVCECWCVESFGWFSVRNYRNRLCKQTNNRSALAASPKHAMEGMLSSTVTPSPVGEGYHHFAGGGSLLPVTSSKVSGWSPVSSPRISFERAGGYQILVIAPKNVVEGWGLPFGSEGVTILRGTAKKHQFSFARAFGARGTLAICWWGSARKTNPLWENARSLLAHFEF